MVKIMENPIKMDDLGVPLFSETSKCFVTNEKYAIILILYTPYAPCMEYLPTKNRRIMVHVSKYSHPMGASGYSIEQRK